MNMRKQTWKAAVSAAATPRRGSLLYKSCMQAFAALAATICASVPANAEYLVTPVHATCQSFFANNNTDRRDALATIDSSSMTLPVTTASSHSTVYQYGMWLSNGTKNTWIAFDLGCEMTISGMHVWNYNEPRSSNRDYFKRGVKTCVLRTGTTMPADGMSYSDAGSWGTAVEAITLQCAPGSAPHIGEDVMFSAPVTTRYVMLYVTDNYGVDNYTGLSEVRFYSNTRRPAYMTGESSSAAFPVSNGDLLQTAVVSVDDSELVIHTTDNDNYSKGTLASLTNGTFGAAGHADGLCIWHGHVTYNLDTNAVPAGYSIGEVAVYTGWGGSGNGREHSSFSVLYRLVNEEEFRHAGTARYKCTIASGNRDTCVRMKDLDLTGVAALRIDFGPDEKSQYYNGEVYKEIDVFGALGRPFSPVAATAQGNYGDRAPGCTIDGSGMSPVPAIDVHAATAGTVPSKTMWLSNGTLDTWIAFDLGEEREITGFHLWNYNENTYNSTKWQNRGIKTAEVYVGTTMPANGGAYSSAGAAWGTLVQNMTFERAPSTGAYTGEDYQFNTPVRGRYFQFKVTGSYTGASPSNYKDNFTGISEIKFYERVVDERVTRLASGTKAIADSPKKDIVIEEGTSGAAAPITLSASTVRANALRTERNIVYGGVAQVDAHGKTLALAEIDVPKGTTALEVLSGTLTCWNSAALWTANWMKWNAGENLTVNANIAANDSGSVSVLKQGSGVLALGGESSQIGTLKIEDGALVIAGGATEVRELALSSDSPSVSVDGNATFKVGAFTGSPSDFDLSINDGTLGTSALGTAVPWLPAFGSLAVGANGATFDTSGASGVVEVPITNATGGVIRKTGSNTLTLKRCVGGAGRVSVEGGTLALALPAPIIHYDFNSISGTTVPNLGTGGAALNGVISGAPEVVAGVEGNALSFCASANGVATAGSVTMRQFTYAAWVKSAGSYNKAQRIIIGGPYASDQVTFLGYLGTDANNMYWAFSRDGNETGRVQSSNDTENWHHVAATYDGETVKLFLDGALLQTTALAHNRMACTMKIGFGNNVTPNTEYWNGAMDEAYVFDRALSADEVAALKENSWQAVNVLDPATDLSIEAGATLALDGVDQTVSTFTLDGRLRCLGETTWGAVGSGAVHETPRITGTGILRVKGPARRGMMLIVK